MSEPIKSELQPITREEIAMERVCNPFNHPYPDWHQSYLWNLQSILANGLLSADIAERANIEAESEGERAPINDNYVSIYRNKPVVEINTGRIGILLKLLEGTETINPDSLDTSVNPYGFREDEILVKRRIAPREFIGLFLGSSMGSSFVRSDLKLDDVLNKMSEVDAGLALPVYDRTGLIWPKKISRGELKERFK